MGTSSSRPQGSRPNDGYNQAPGSSQGGRPGGYQDPPYPPYRMPQQVGPGGYYPDQRYWGAYGPSGAAPPRNPYGMPPPAPNYPYGPPPPAHSPAPTHEYQQTSTIRNQVNLKKQTLELVALEGEAAGRLAIRFKFDASAPCRATTFVMATEDARRGCAVSLPRGAAPAAPVAFPKGLGQQFPPADTPLASSAHVVDLSSVREPSSLSSARCDTYPLLVRLESLTEQGRSEGRRLEDLEPGCALPRWVQCQMTYATLHKDEHGVWCPRVLKQKIWVNDVSYELQEIYGLEQSSNRRTSASGGGGGGMATGSAAGGTATGTAVDDIDGRECVICLSAERDTTVLPCRHMCMCNECARALKTQTNRCPICRVEIESLLHIKIQKAPPPPPPAATQTAGAGAGVS